MAETNPEENADVDRFIMERIDTVPHLEALLMMWREHPRRWSAETMARRLWVHPEVARAILQDLARDRLAVAVADQAEYHYRSEPEQDRLLARMNESYRREMIRISNMIHSKPSSAIREFARAFRLRKRD